MARSPAHKFGQIIGETLEIAIEPLLQEFAQKYGFYLDKKGSRPARRRKTVSWSDLYDNAHDLDFVLERNGDENRLGDPIAFIETAWRRYTKHSRNKAQEIQGAVIPLSEKYHRMAPFKGAVLAGVFTEGALVQLKSLGFVVLYFPYETVVQAFNQFGFDAFFDEKTPDADLTQKVHTWEALSPQQRLGISQALVQINATEVVKFMESLERSVSRKVESVWILPLYGTGAEIYTLEDAIAFMERYTENSDGPKTFVRYEIEIRYTNKDSVNGKFSDKQDAIQFLRTFILLP